MGTLSSADWLDSSSLLLHADRSTLAIDLLVHHGSDKTVQIILHPDEKNRSRIQEFFADHGRIAVRAFRDRLQVRIADTTSQHYNKNTKMHDNSIITDSHCTFGSYNLSSQARYQSWESLHVADTDQSQLERFDTLKLEVENAEDIKSKAEARGVNFYYPKLTRTGHEPVSLALSHRS